MIWKLLIIFFGLASARDYVEPEYLDELRASGQDDKFAELLGIKKHLIRPDDSDQRSEGSIFNHASFLGDILLTEEQERNAMNFTEAYWDKKWPYGRIPYFISDDFDDIERRFIRSSIAKLNKKVKNLQIVPRKRQKDYVYIFNGKGCFCSIGKTGGQQPLSLQKSGCLRPGAVHHEFMHAAGFEHEHNRKDRDNYVEVLWDNIPKNWTSQYQKVPDYGWLTIGKYDYYSVMHYPIKAPETDKDAFKIPDEIDRSRLGQEDGVTDDDVEKIDILYS